MQPTRRPRARRTSRVDDQNEEAEKALAEIAVQQGGLTALIEDRRSFDATLSYDHMKKKLAKGELCQLHHILY